MTTLIIFIAICLLLFGIGVDLYEEGRFKGYDEGLDDTMDIIKQIYQEELEKCSK